MSALLSAIDPDLFFLSSHYKTLSGICSIFCFSSSQREQCEKKFWGFCLSCGWVGDLTGFFRLFVADRGWGSAVFSSKYFNLTKALLTKHELICINE